MMMTMLWLWLLLLLLLQWPLLSLMALMLDTLSPFLSTPPAFSRVFKPAVSTHQLSAHQPVRTAVLVVVPKYLSETITFSPKPRDSLKTTTPSLHANSSKQRVTTEYERWFLPGQSCLF